MNGMMNVMTKVMMKVMMKIMMKVVMKVMKKVFFCRRCTAFINKIIKKLHCDRRSAFQGVTSQVPQPTCFWKWVGRTNPKKSGILTLEVSFSAKKNSTVKSSTELGRVIQYLQILPSGNIF